MSKVANETRQKQLCTSLCITSSINQDVPIKAYTEQVFKTTKLCSIKIDCMTYMTNLRAIIFVL